MTKLQLKKQILKDARSVDTFYVSVIIWHGESDDFDSAVFLDVTAYQGTPPICGKDYCTRKELNDDMGYAYGSTLEDTEENTELIRKEQKDIVKYLTKQGFKVTSSEQNI